MDPSLRTSGPDRNTIQSSSTISNPEYGRSAVSYSTTRPDYVDFRPESTLTNVYSNPDEDDSRQLSIVSNCPTNPNGENTYDVPNHPAPTTPDPATYQPFPPREDEAKAKLQLSFLTSKVKKLSRKLKCYVVTSSITTLTLAGLVIYLFLTRNNPTSELGVTTNKIFSVCFW